MKIEVVDEKANPLLKRKEVRFRVSFDAATPSRKEVKEKLCTHLKAKPELTVVDEMGQGYGSKEVFGYAKVYENADALKIELKHIIRRDKGEKAEKKAKEAKKAPPKAA